MVFAVNRRLAFSLLQTPPIGTLSRAAGRAAALRGGVYNDYYHYDDDDYEDDDYETHQGGYKAPAAPPAGGSPFDMLGGVGAATSSSGGRDRKLGFLLSGGGVALTFLGVMLFFNSALLRLGNLLFLAGMPLIIGPSRAASYFTSRQRLRATATFLAGVFLVVFAGWPVLGLLVEAFGFLNLFGNLFPLLKGLLQPILSRFTGGGSQATSRRGYDGDY